MKKFILRVVACLMMAAMIGTCMGNAGTALADDLEVGYTGTATFSDTAWWTEKELTLPEVHGDVAPEDVVKIVFTSDTAFALGYNTSAEGGWNQRDQAAEHDCTDIFLGEGGALKLALSKGDGVDYTITWKVYKKAAATAPAEAPKTEAPKTEAPVSNDLVITFADLTAGGYGYDAKVNGGAVDVTIASQYQEIQYVLPEVVDLAAYTTLIVDVTSNAQLDIKLVDPNAELNQYSQLAPFHDGYTAEGQGITEPVTFDLAQFADKDLSQINFMAMGNDTAFTIKNITFVSPVKETPVETPVEEPAETPVETPVEEPAEEPAETPVETPVEEPAETPVETPVEEPAETPVETPVEEPAEVPATSDNTTTGREVKEGETVYTVQKGDCLWVIAKKFLGKGARYTELFERNSDILTDATLIKKGQEIIIPAK